jgi:hypothetical protein
MLMEPDEQHGGFSIVPSESRVIYPTYNPQPTVQQSGFRPIFPGYSRNARVSVQERVDQPSQAEQNFFPTFFRESPPSGHSRPYYPVATERPAGGRYFGNTAAAPQNGRAITFDQSILGSGNFGVIRGGTFYQENDPSPTPLRGSEHNNHFYNSFYNKNNGHGRPHAAPLSHKIYNGDEQFSNFRDFADINTPNDPAYSQFVVVYANKNSTVSNAEYKNPKNIFEQLELLDREKEEEEKRLAAKKPAKKPYKISKFKVKLQATKTEKSYRKRQGPKDLNEEPLLALS